MKAVFIVVAVLAFAGLASGITLTSDAGTYTSASATTTDVASSLAVSQSIADVKALLTSNTDYAAVKALYASSGLKAIADKDRTGEPIWDVFKAHFDSPTWITDFVHKATDGTTISADSSARAELIEKTVMDAVLVQAVISDCYNGQKDNDQALWDHCAAKFIGKTTSTIFGRANKRGKNYGTLIPDTETALVNKAIIAELNKGPTKAAYDAIVNQIKTVYAQASLRYAFLVDKGIASMPPTSTAEKQAEGYAFWRSLSPWVAAGDATGAATVTEFFNPTSAPNSAHWYNYCMLNKILKATLSIPAVDMGTLEDTDDVSCVTTAAPVTKITTEAGDYTATVDVGASVALSQAMTGLKALVGPKAADYAAVKSTYQVNGVGGAADKDRSGEPVWDTFFAYYGSRTWNSDFLFLATDGTTQTADANGRAELIKKTMLDAVSIQAVISDLYNGYKKSDQKLWDQGAAKYIGDKKSGIWGRAEKRGANYGTVAASGVANANKNALAALIKGPSKANYDTVVHQIKVVYAQATLRYAFLVDGKITSGEAHIKSHAEGAAFWRCLAPWVKAKNAASATSIDAVFDISKTPTATNNFCVTKAALASLEISDVDMGTLENTAGVDCSDPAAPSGTSGTPPADSAAPSSSVIVAFAALIVGAVVSLL